MRLGLAGALRAAVLVPAAGLAIEGGAALWIVAGRTPGFGASGGWLRVLAVWMLALLALVAGYAIPARGVRRMRAIVRRDPPESAAPQLARLCPYARWQSASVTGVTVATGIIFWLSPLS